MVARKPPMTAKLARVIHTLLSRSPSVLVIGVSWWATLATAADLTIKDGDTLIRDGTTYRLDGIDAPEMDQECLDEKGTEWPCGIAAREALERFIGGRNVECKDQGPDQVYPGGRRTGICFVDGVNLNEWLVREGWALNFEPYARGRFLEHQADAERERRGMWKGCFVAPWDLRNWNKSNATLMGLACGVNTEARAIFFPDHADMPPGCPIIGNITRRVEKPYLPHGRLPQLSQDQEPEPLVLLGR
jgi:endonuclease YncB( thermonuclease family)